MPPMRSPLFTTSSRAIETDTSLDFAYKCGYISQEQHKELTDKCRRVGQMLGKMLQNPKPFLIAEK